MARIATHHLKWLQTTTWTNAFHNDVIKWKQFPRYWTFVRGIHRSPVNSPHKFQWRGALIFSLICARVNGWVNNRKAGDMRRHVSARIQNIVSWVRNEMGSVIILVFCHQWYFETLVFIKYVQMFYRNSTNNLFDECATRYFLSHECISIHYSLLL